MTNGKSKRKKIGSGRPVQKAWMHPGGGRRRPGERAYDATILLRIYSEDREVLAKAAKRDGKSLSGFLREQAVEAARKILDQPRAS